MTGMSFRSPRIALAAIGLAGIAASFLSPIARADDDELPVVRYVALGDSYTAAPLSSVPAGTPGGSYYYDGDDNPYTCGQSDTNYPRQIARWLGLCTTTYDVPNAGLEPTHPAFVDISCGGAKTTDMWTSQTISYGGSNPRQLDAFEGIDREAVELVTIGIGGNDVGFGRLQTECVEKPNTPGGSPCSENPELVMEIQSAIGELSGRLTALVAEVHRLAPNADILLFGYPALLPEEPVLSGLPEGCWPYIPILPKDVTYLRNVEKALNDTIRNASAGAFTHYVDWYKASIGHDMCQPPGIAWVNGVVLAPPSFPVHPNVLGSMGAADAGIAVLETMPRFSLEA